MCVNPVFCKQFLMGAGFSNNPFIEDDDFVGPAHGRKPVRNDDDRPGADKSLDCRLNFRLCFCINSSSSLIKNSDFGIA